MSIVVNGEEKTYQGFIDFVNTQSPEREIQHIGPNGMASWQYCAVGDYIGDTSYSEACEFSWVIASHNTRLWVLLDDADESTKIFPNYGALQQWLRENS